ncbi:MAG: hypothetical protein KF715_19715 [Candidatus Didemnitutus sp.]|nr:hypothetical protein [Candidatus Didemnitutus sp.]
MKRMLIVVIVIAVVVGGGLFACGLARASKKDARKSPAVQTPRSFDELQGSVTLDVQPEYPGDTPEKRALLRRLKREERRQRPQEGRN